MRKMAVVHLCILALFVASTKGSSMYYMYSNMIILDGKRNYYVFYNYNESADTLEFMVQISLGWFQCIENWTESVTWIFVCFLPPTN